MVVSASFIIAWLAAHGCSAACGAGIVGNLQAESGLHVCIRGPSGLGLPQWMGERRDRFLNHFGTKECRVEDQLVFLVQELDEMGIKGQLFAETNPRRAAELFMKVFEKPRLQGARHVEHRCQIAEQIYFSQR